MHSYLGGTAVIHVRVALSMWGKKLCTCNIMESGKFKTHSPQFCTGLHVHVHTSACTEILKCVVQNYVPLPIIFEKGQDKIIYMYILVRMHD